MRTIRDRLLDAVGRHDWSAAKELADLADALIDQANTSWETRSQYDLNDSRWMDWAIRGNVIWYLIGDQVDIDRFQKIARNEGKILETS